MASYGEILRKFIKDSGMSVRKLSVETDINRALLQKYLSGERLPKNIKEVQHISECLMLSPEKKEALLECYNRSRYGAKRYDSFLMIRDMLNGQADFRTHSVSSTAMTGSMESFTDATEENGFLQVAEGSRACVGRMEVENALRAILKRQQKSGGEWGIQLIAQPETGNLLKTILSVCGSQSQRGKVEQIICLDEDSSEGNNNIQTVYNLLPMLFGSVSYESFYYYDRKDSHINSMSLLPVMILAGDSAMICNYKMDEGLVFSNKESVSFCCHQYQTMKKRTSPLTKYFKDNVTEWMSFRQNFMTDLAVAEICVGSIPCITYALNETILAAVLRLDTEGNQMLMDIFAKNRNTFLRALDKKAPVNIFEEKGLRYFMETGRTDEYPYEWYIPVPVPYRLHVLESMIFMAENNYMEYIMTNSDLLTIDENLLIYVNENVVFQYHQDNQLSQYFSINERGVRRSFQEFIGFAEENGWLHDADGTTRRMKEILEEYKRLFETV